MQNSGTHPPEPDILLAHLRGTAGGKTSPDRRRIFQFFPRIPSHFSRYHKVNLAYKLPIFPQPPSRSNRKPLQNCIRISEDKPLENIIGSVLE